METPQASGLPPLPLHSCVFAASRSLSHVSPFLFLHYPCAPFLTQRNTASGPSPPSSREGTAPPGLAPAAAPGAAGGRSGARPRRAKGAGRSEGRREAGRAWAGRLCRSELRVGDSSADAGWEAGILTHCGSGGAAGWRAVCSGASPAPFSPCNLLQEEGRPRGIPWVRVLLRAFQTAGARFPGSPRGAVLSLFVYFHTCPPETPSERSFLIRPLMKSGGPGTWHTAWHVTVTWGISQSQWKEGGGPGGGRQGRRKEQTKKKKKKEAGSASISAKCRIGLSV